MADTTKQQLLTYAVARVGREVLAARLKVTQARLSEWVEGRREMPDAKLDPLADVLAQVASGGSNPGSA